MFSQLSIKKGKSDCHVIQLFASYLTVSITIIQRVCPFLERKQFNVPNVIESATILGNWIEYLQWRNYFDWLAPGSRKNWLTVTGKWPLSLSQAAVLWLHQVGAVELSRARHRIWPKYYLGHHLKLYELQSSQAAGHGTTKSGRSNANGSCNMRNGQIIAPTSNRTMHTHTQRTMDQTVGRHGWLASRRVHKCTFHWNLPWHSLGLDVNGKHGVATVYPIAGKVVGGSQSNWLDCRVRVTSPLWTVSEHHEEHATTASRRRVGRRIFPIKSISYTVRIAS